MAKTNELSFEGADKILDDLTRLEIPANLFSNDGHAIIAMKVSDLALGVQVVTVRSFAGVLTDEAAPVICTFRVGERGLMQATAVAFNWLRASVRVLNDGVNYAYGHRGYPLVVSKS